MTSSSIEICESLSVHKKPPLEPPLLIAPPIASFVTSTFCSASVKEEYSFIKSPFKEYWQTFLAVPFPNSVLWYTFSDWETKRKLSNALLLLFPSIWSMIRFSGIFPLYASHIRRWAE